MALEEVTMYAVRCDKCGDYLEDSEGATAFDCRLEAEDFGKTEDWQVDDGKHYCYKCITGKEKGDE